MPIYRDPDRQPESPVSDQHLMKPPLLTRQSSDESIRTEFCDGPVTDDHVVDGKKLQVTDDVPRPSTSDRNELIESIKRGESPTWVPGDKVKLSATLFANLLCNTLLFQAVRPGSSLHAFFFQVCDFLCLRLGFQKDFASIMYLFGNTLDFVNMADNRSFR